MGAGDQPGHRHAKARPASIGTVGVTLSGTGGAGDWSTGAYSYYGVGNITAQLADGIKSETETFTYDRLSRLTNWLRNGVANESYGFDPFGNLINYNGRTLSVLGTTNRLAAAGYDASGNMTAWMSFSFTWGALGRMTALAGNGLHRRFAATADGERVVEREGSTYTFSLRGLDNRVLREMKATWTGAGWAWEWEKDSIWGAGRLLASVSRRDGIRHAHVDHLGSPRLLTNRCGQRVALLDHNPWGLDRPTGVQDGERHRFTAHQRDLGLLDRTWDDFDYMHARTYTPYLGRFVSVDPGRDHDSKVPQSWNLYAYVRGNPMNALDEEGRDTHYVNRYLALDRLSPLLTGRDAAPRSSWATHTFIAVTDERGVVVATYSWDNEPDPHNAGIEGKWFADEHEDILAAQQALALGLAEPIGGSELDPYVHQAFRNRFNRANDPSNHRNLLLDRNCKFEAARLIAEARQLKLEDDKIKRKEGEESQRKKAGKNKEKKEDGK